MRDPPSDQLGASISHSLAIAPAKLGPVVPFYRFFFGEGSPTKIDNKKVLLFYPLYWRTQNVKYRSKKRRAPCTWCHHSHGREATTPRRCSHLGARFVKGSSHVESSLAPCPGYSYLLGRSVQETSFFLGKISYFLERTAFIRPIAQTCSGEPFCYIKGKVPFCLPGNPG